MMFFPLAAMLMYPAAQWEGFTSGYTVTVRYWPISFSFWVAQITILQNCARVKEALGRNVPSP